MPFASDVVVHGWDFLIVVFHSVSAGGEFIFCLVNLAKSK